VPGWFPKGNDPKLDNASNHSAVKNQRRGQNLDPTGGRPVSVSPAHVCMFKHRERFNSQLRDTIGIWRNTSDQVMETTCVTVWSVGHLHLSLDEERGAISWSMDGFLASCAAGIASWLCLTR